MMSSFARTQPRHKPPSRSAVPLRQRQTRGRFATRKIDAGRSTSTRTCSAPSQSHSMSGDASVGRRTTFATILPQRRRAPSASRTACPPSRAAVVGQTTTDHMEGTTVVTDVHQTNLNPNDMSQLTVDSHFLLGSQRSNANSYASAREPVPSLGKTQSQDSGGSRSFGQSSALYFGQKSFSVSTVDSNQSNLIAGSHGSSDLSSKAPRPIFRRKADVRPALNHRASDKTRFDDILPISRRKFERTPKQGQRVPPPRIAGGYHLSASKALSSSNCTKELGSLLRNAQLSTDPKTLSSRIEIKDTSLEQISDHEIQRKPKTVRGNDDDLYSKRMQEITNALRDAKAELMELHSNQVSGLEELMKDAREEGKSLQDLIVCSKTAREELLVAVDEGVGKLQQCTGKGVEQLKKETDDGVAAIVAKAKGVWSAFKAKLRSVSNIVNDTPPAISPTPKAVSTLEKPIKKKVAVKAGKSSTRAKRHFSAEDPPTPILPKRPQKPRRAAKSKNKECVKKVSPYKPLDVVVLNQEPLAEIETGSCVTPEKKPSKKRKITVAARPSRKVTKCSQFSQTYSMNEENFDFLQDFSQ